MKTCAIIDNNPASLHSIYRSLRHEDYAIECFASAEKAASIINRQPHRFQVAICDYILQGADGLELLTHLQRRHPHIIRILRTSQADFEEVRRNTKAGTVFRFVSKPAPLSVIRQTVRDGFTAHRGLSFANAQTTYGQLATA